MFRKYLNLLFLQLPYSVHVCDFNARNARTFILNASAKFSHLDDYAQNVYATVDYMPAPFVVNLTFLC